LAAIEAGCARLLVKRMIMSSFGELGGTSAAAAYIEAGYKANAGNKAFEGAYFAKHLEQARQQGRIGQVAIRGTEGSKEKTAAWLLSPKPSSSPPISLSCRPC
jgi:hypothetical protein